MVLIEKPIGVHNSTIESIISVDFQPENDNNRLVVASKCNVNIWCIKVAICDNENAQCTSTLNISNSSEISNINTDNCNTPSISNSHLNTTIPVEEVTHKNITSEKYEKRSCKIFAHNVCTLSNHSPQYVVIVKWSPSGQFLATSDSRQVIIWKFSQVLAEKKTVIAPFTFYNEQWKNVDKFVESSFDIFSLCWFGNEFVVTGSVDGFKIWSLENKGFVKTIQCTEGFVKGLNEYHNQMIALQSNDRRALVYKISNDKNYENPSFELLLEETELLTQSPMETAFDPLGIFVSFPYGERGQQCFGFMYHLTNLKTPPYRFRGHLLRVNCVAFSTVVWTEIKNNVNRFTLYAQASLDGTLSVWKVYYPQEDIDNITSTCLIVLKPRFMDEQASVTDLTWSFNGLMLTISADDGTLTFIVFTLEELEAKPCQKFMDSKIKYIMKKQVEPVSKIKEKKEDETVSARRRVAPIMIT